MRFDPIREMMRQVALQLDDFLASHDLEDIVGVIEGRPELVAECFHAPATLRAYLQKQLTTLLSNRDFSQALPGHVLEAGRLPIVRRRLMAIAAGSALADF